MARLAATAGTGAAGGGQPENNRAKECQTGVSTEDEEGLSGKQKKKRGVSGNIRVRTKGASAWSDRKENKERNERNPWDVAALG